MVAFDPRGRSREKYGTGVVKVVAKWYHFSNSPSMLLSELVELATILLVAEELPTLERLCQGVCLLLVSYTHSKVRVSHSLSISHSSNEACYPLLFYRGIR